MNCIRIREGSTNKFNTAHQKNKLIQLIDSECRVILKGLRSLPWNKMRRAGRNTESVLTLRLVSFHVATSYLMECFRLRRLTLLSVPLFEKNEKLVFNRAKDERVENRAPGALGIKSREKRLQIELCTQCYRILFQTKQNRFNSSCLARY